MQIWDITNRMSDLHGAIAVEQLKKVEEFTKKRQENARKLNECLGGRCRLLKAPDY